MRALVPDMRAQWAKLDRRIRAFDVESAGFVRENEDAHRLVIIPGVGPLIASALTAAIGAGETFESARDLAAWQGLTPRQAATDGEPKLLGISSAATDVCAR
jgi:transposase